MADSSVGEPLVLRHGVALYSAESTYGTAVTPATSAGNCMLGWRKHSSNAEFDGPGSPNFVVRKGGSAYTEWTMRWGAYQTGLKALLLNAARTAGTLPLLTLGFGFRDDTATGGHKHADQIQDCKVGQLELVLDASNGHSPLAVTMSGIGGLVTDLTTLVPALEATKPWATWEGVHLKAAAAYENRSFRMQVNHNLRRDHVNPGAAPSTFKRGHKYLTEQQERITGEITTYSKPSEDVQAATVSEFTYGVTLTSGDDSIALAVALTSVAWGEIDVDEDESGIFFRCPFTAKTWAPS